jgi:thiol-disulfide isomerase/thioredoxin
MKFIRLLSTVIALTFAAQFLGAQNYFYIFENGTLPPYEYNETEDAYDIATSGNDMMTAQQTMPFNWNFYGLSVNSYYASDNGYITFNSAPGTSNPNNVALPDGSAPTNAIFAFWDDLDYAGGTVRKWDYGIEPNRIHCIQWSNMQRVGTGSSVTATIRIHESGHFDIIHDLSSGGAVSNTNGTVGSQNASANSAMMIGNAFFAYPNLTADNYDDHVYMCDFGNQQTKDLSVINTNIKPASAAGSYAVSGVIKNFGSAPIQTFELNYQLDNGPVFTDNANTLTLVANGGEYQYFHNTNVNLATPGTFYTLKIWASNLNGGVDGNATNDTLRLDIVTVLGNNAPKHVVVEEFTATWCGACPTGLAYMDTVYTNFPGQVIGVANHASDGFSFQNSLFEYYGVSGIPDGMVDRAGLPYGASPLNYPTVWPTGVAARLNEPCPVEVEVFNTYDPTTRLVTGEVVMRYSDYAMGDMRAILYITEDGLPGNQAGLGAHTFNHILRALPMGEFGTSGMIPDFVNPGESYSVPFSFTMPAMVNINNVNFVGAVMRYDVDKRKHEILNAGQGPLDNGVSAQDPDNASQSLGVIPNPVHNLGAIKVQFAKPAQASFTLYNAVGQQIKLLKEGKFTKGIHHVYFDATTLAAGIYYIKVNSDQGQFTEKVVVQ